MSRPLFRATIAELEMTFGQSLNNAAALDVLLKELRHRSTDRAKKLMEAVEREIHRTSSNAKGKRVADPSSLPPHLKEPPEHPEKADSGKTETVRREPPPVTNPPDGILSAWTALEVLSPPAFRRPSDLAGGDHRAVAQLTDESLPWERGEKSRPNFRLYYQIILGTVKMEPALDRLIKSYGDSRPERPAVRGDAILAVVIVDRQGRLVESPAVSVSSFGWGVMAALKGELTDLAKWPHVEPEIVRRVERKLINFAEGDDEEEKRKAPLTRDAIMAAYRMLVHETGLPAELVEPPAFAIRSYEYFKSPTPPEPLLLNSFFLADLEKAQGLLKEGKMPTVLKRYLGIEHPAQRADLLRDGSALEQAIAPGVTNLGRWPGPNRHSLALLQQAAVNLAFSESKGTGIIGVNGPPGTGKTTLLRDILAGAITDRAQAMCRFNDPEDAFTHSGEKLKAGNGWLHLYRLDSGLRGFEMVVASSNNKAVENVSRELPAMESIAEDASELWYLKILSDELHGRETWGLIAAVLGNAGNRARFKKTFWWDEDLSLNSYLSAVAGSVPQIQETDPATGKSIFRLPRIVTEEKPPTGHDDALVRWNKARKAFRAALEASQKWQKWLEGVREQLLKLPQAISDEARALESRNQSIQAVEHLAKLLQEVEAQTVEANSRLQKAETDIHAHRQHRPGFWALLFRTAKARAWGHTHRQLRNGVDEARSHLAQKRDEQGQIEQALQVSKESSRQAEVCLSELATAQAAIEAQLKEAQERFGVLLPNVAFFAQEHGEKHRTTPWYPQAAQRARDDLFVAAVQLHRAFVDAAAKPMRHNLGALMNVISGGSLPSKEKEALLPDVWASLFLAVPLVSTTFAAVSRMLGKLPPQSLGWLLIDEAGQALPQAAVGAMIRCRRVVVVGDPAQIEPVVLLPDSLSNTIARSFGVDPDTYAAPGASVQTLADAASSFGSEFQTKSGSRMVGVPLLVHRRCAEPMFTISNAIAYSGLMVQAKKPKQSAIRDVLGNSRWIHVEGSGEDKWCEEEGQQVLQLLRTLAGARVSLDLYIVSPFVIVAERLRQIIRESGVLRGSAPESEVWKWVSERVGTVHTVQGREAEAVIFVLGAPKTGQSGARGWAGGRPNLLNVAITRAQEVLYVIGNRTLWRVAGHFGDLDAHFG